MQNNQRRLINLFKDFLERAIMPEIRRNDSLSASCQYFTTILTQQPIDFIGLQAIVDTFPSNRGGQYGEQNKPPPVFAKRKEEAPPSYQYGSENPNGFNPSRTFGGERSRFNMYPAAKKPDVSQTTSNSNDFKQPLQTQTSKSLASMQNIYRTFLQNQQKLQQIAQQSSSSYAPKNIGGVQDRQYY